MSLLDSQAPVVGSTIGDYRLMSRLGDGGMGIVYKALHLPTQCEYALKWFRPGRASSWAIRTAFECCSVINHPGIVRFRDIDERSRFLVMDLVEGLALRWRLKQIKTLPLSDVLELALALGDSVQTLHGANVLHRDIRAINIYLTQRGPVLIDVGVPYSMDLPEQSIDLARSGPTACMAPEVLTRHEFTIHSDIYSLAAVLYRALVGKVPARNQAGEHVPHCIAEMGKSEALLQVLRIGLDPRPECRFATVNAMVRALIAQSSE